MSAGMRITRRAILVIAFVLAGFGFAAPRRSLVATMERVSDRDTMITLSENGTRLRLRLLGIDAPEIAHGNNPGQPFGRLDTGDHEA